MAMAGVGWSTVVAAASGFLLGCRHGLDWDHVAAITDLTAAGRARRRPGGVVRGSLALAVWYCLGHGLVIVLLGLGVAVVGVRLPDRLDRIAEVVVGVTLVGLGLVVLWQLGRDRSAYRFTGRWRPVVAVVRRAWARLRRRRSGPTEAFDDLGPGSAFAIGVLHGTGAETPTQVVLVATAAAAGSSLGAALILGAFVCGLVGSDVGIAAVWLGGLGGTRRRPAVHLGLGTLTGVASLAVGGLFVSGRAGMLPALFGG